MGVREGQTRAGVRQGFGGEIKRVAAKLNSLDDKLDDLNYLMRRKES